MNSDQILSTKRSVLSSKGVRYNSLYYNAHNSDVSLLECTFGYRYRTSLSSSQFGSSSTFNIPINNFQSTILLHLRLPNLQASECLAPSWGYRMLASIQYALGASSSTNIVLQKDGIILAILSQCDTLERRNEVMKLGGQGYLGPVIAGIGEDVDTIDAYCLIPIPAFSDMCGHLPIDTTLMANTISVTIQFESDPKCIYGGSATHPSSFTVAEIMLRDGKLSDQSASVRSKMVKDPNLKYNIPMIHNQYFPTQTFAGKRRSDGKVQVELSTFPNGDLVGIAFWVIRDDFKTPTGTNAPNPFVTDEISDILVTFGGSTLFDFPGKSYKMAGMCIGKQGPAYFQTQQITGSGAGPFTSTGKDCYIVFLDFAQVRSACSPSQLQNTWRLPNNQLRVEFSTSQGSSVNYTLHAVYFVNSVVELENGTSSIFID
jgi:hypothetical protein